MRDADIDDSDIPRLDKSFWKTVKLTMAELKDRLTIRATMTLSNDSRRPEGLPDPHQRHLRSYMKAQSARSQGLRRMGHPAEA
jgi:hypothetical protein